MRLLKNSWFVCCQNFRKWRHDYRIILAAILILIEVNYFSGSLGTICSSLGLKMSPWLFPFLFTAQWSSIVFFLPLLFIFCNAPFIDANQPYSIIRTGRTAWSIGQVIYVALTTAIYLLFIIFASIILHIGHLEFTSGWGKLFTSLGNLTFHSDIQINIFIPTRIINYFSPFQAMWFTFLFLWFSGMFIGLLVYFFNSLTNTRIVGMGIASAFLVFDSFLSQTFITLDLTYFLYHFSPVTWSHLNLIEIDYGTTQPTFPYVMVMYIILNVILIVGCIWANRKQTIEVLPPV